MDFLKKVKTFFELIKFEHSIFALPFAYLGLFLSANGFPRLSVFVWVTTAMVALRTSAMCLNRLIDEVIDEKNPRTQRRVIAIRLIKRPVIWCITFFSISLYLYATSRLNHLCFILSPIGLILIWTYPHMKKITWFSHLILGMILGCSPYAGWLANTPEWDWKPFFLAIAVTTWVAGFDMFYALQDMDFDRSYGLKSFPAQFGLERTVIAVRFFHLITILSLGWFGWSSNLGLWYWAGLGIATVLIVREHYLVARFGLVKIDEAFFNMNAWVSVVIFLAVMLDLVVKL